MRDLVSVIIPMYNSEKYIIKTIESVLNQTYSNIEIIVVNDGSKDNSFQLVSNKFGDKIKLINKKNGGVSSARNFGIKSAEGKYIMFLDSDDTIKKECIEICMNNIEDNDQVIFNYNTIENNKIEKVSAFKQKNIDLSTKRKKENFIINDFFRFKSGWVIWNRIFKKELILKNNIIFSEKYNMGEDQLFCLEYLLCAKKIKIIKNSLYNYEINENSITNTNKINLFKKREMYNDRMSKISDFESIYRFLFIYIELAGVKKNQVITIFKDMYGNKWKIKIFCIIIKNIFKIKFLFVIKIIKNLYIDVFFSKRWRE